MLPYSQMLFGSVLTGDRYCTASFVTSVTKTNPRIGSFTVLLNIAINRLFISLETNTFW